MKKGLKKVLSAVVAASFIAGAAVVAKDNTALPSINVGAVDVYADNTYITKQGGWFETAYVQWSNVDGADGYAAYVKGAAEADSAYKLLDNELIRKYPDYWRADAVGLKAGDYIIKVVPYTGDQALEDKAFTTNTLTVDAYDRSGAAFSSKSGYSAGIGAYNNDGTLKSGAKVFYVTADTAKTITCDVVTSAKGAVETRTGFQDIIDGKQKGFDTTPYDFRIIGTVTFNDLDKILSSEEGIQVKGKDDYSEMNITIEGIGEDAAVNGFGFLINKCKSVEFRNFGLFNFMDDGVSIDSYNSNLWMHNLDFFYGAAGSSNDQKKGDGSLDLKKHSTYITVSYNHFWDSGKCCMCGMKEDYGKYDYHITYHHNWFDHSDSRHPRIRSMSVHMYNNYFDGNSKYGVGVTSGASAFVENNYFKNCKHPMLSSLQGSDLMGRNKTTNAAEFNNDNGTFSKESGGSIKAYNNIVIGSNEDEINGGVEPIYYDAADTSSTGKAVHFDAYLASSRDEKVPSTVKVLSPGSYSSTYNNFDTDTSKFDLAVNLLTPVEEVPAVVTASAGRLNGGDFPKDKSIYTAFSDSTSYAVDDALKNDVVNYKTTLVSVGGLGKAIEQPSTVSTVETSTETTTASTVSATETSTEQTTEKTTTNEGTTDNDVTEMVWGDTNGTRKIEAADAANVLQYVLNKNAVSFTPQVIVHMDVNADNNVDAADAAEILQKALVSTFTFEAEKK